MRAQDVLKEYWGYDTFRKPQDEIVESVLKGNDTLALLPTGGGKSICFQVPGIILPGLTIVISPLIALMQDQVANLVKRGIAATEVNSSMGWKEVDRRLDMAMGDGLKFLYCAPERLKTEVFLARVQSMNVSLIAVDEAHCISQWGYDFRPSYLEIPMIRQLLPDVPVIALTASATPIVEKDICERLQLRSPKIFRKSFLRENLSYRVLDSENVNGDLINLATKLKGSGIVYARTRKRVEKIAEMLNKHGISSRPYHGGMEASKRTEIQEAWVENSVQVIAATNAFGMGIDKPDVRFVIHYNLPADLESYYQEAGRGGRDGETAWAFAFRNDPDIRELELWVKERYPTFADVVTVYDSLCDFFRLPDRGTVDQIHPLEYQTLSAMTGIQVNRIFGALRILNDEGYIGLNESPDDRGVLRIIISPADIRRFMLSHPGMNEGIEFLLRALGGSAFTEEVRILPKFFFRKYPASAMPWEKLMVVLHERGVVEWQAPMSSPSIRFFRHRETITQQLLNWKKYEFLADRAKEKLDQLLNFAREKQRCRTAVICEYFGENKVTDCGKCDNCLRKQAGSFSGSVFEQIKAEMISLLRSKPQHYSEIPFKLKSGIPEHRESVLRYLVDEKIIFLEENAMAYLNPDQSAEE